MAVRHENTMRRILPTLFPLAIICVVTGVAAKCASKWPSRQLQQIEQPSKTVNCKLDIWIAWFGSVKGSEKVSFRYSDLP